MRRRTCSVSWGGVAAQEFARTAAGERWRLILCATIEGMFHAAGHPSDARGPRRGALHEQGLHLQVSGDIYGGDFRRQPELAAEFMAYVKVVAVALGLLPTDRAATGTGPAMRGCALPENFGAHTGDSGRDDPLIHTFNARLMRSLIPNSANSSCSTAATSS